LAQSKTELKQKQVQTEIRPTLKHRKAISTVVFNLVTLIEGMRNSKLTKPGLVMRMGGRLMQMYQPGVQVAHINTTGIH